MASNYLPAFPFGWHKHTCEIPDVTVLSKEYSSEHALISRAELSLSDCKEYIEKELDKLRDKFEDPFTFVMPILFRLKLIGYYFSGTDKSFSSCVDDTYKGPFVIVSAFVSPHESDIGYYVTYYGDSKKRTVAFSEKVENILMTE